VAPKVTCAGKQIVPDAQGIWAEPAGERG